MQRNYWWENNPDHCLQMISLQQSLQCDLIPGETMLYCDHINLCDIYPPGAEKVFNLPRACRLLVAFCCKVLFLDLEKPPLNLTQPCPLHQAHLWPQPWKISRTNLYVWKFLVLINALVLNNFATFEGYIYGYNHICIGLSIGFFQWIIRLPLSVCQFLSWTLVGRQERGVEASSRDGNWNPEKSASQLEGAAAGGRLGGRGVCS